MRDDISSSKDFSEAATKGQWSIVFGGIPVNLHLEEKGMEPLSFANEAMKWQNHDYIEIRGPEGEVFRRIQAYEPNMKMFGRMMGATYGSKGTGFEKDIIYHDDPHGKNENMLRSGDNPEQASTIVMGTKEQILSIYHQGLVGVINGNNKDLDFNAVLGGNNGNAFTAEILEKMQEAGRAMGLTVKNFDPKGADIDFDKDTYDFPAGQAICFQSEQELLDAISSLEALVSEQHAAITANSGVDLETEIPERDKLTCPPAPTLIP